MRVATSGPARGAGPRRVRCGRTGRRLAGPLLLVPPARSPRKSDRRPIAVAIGRFLRRGGGVSSLVSHQHVFALQDPPVCLRTPRRGRRPRASSIGTLRRKPLDARFCSGVPGQGRRKGREENPGATLRPSLAKSREGGLSLRSPSAGGASGSPDGGLHPLRGEARSGSRTQFQAGRTARSWVPPRIRSCGGGRFSWQFRFACNRTGEDSAPSGERRESRN